MEAAAGLEEEGGDLPIHALPVRFLRPSFSWNLVDIGGVRAQPEMHPVNGNGEATNGGALDTGDSRGHAPTKAHQRVDEDDQTLPTDKKDKAVPGDSEVDAFCFFVEHFAVLDDLLRYQIK
uniref:Uncharacterized protein n=1 Tax=Oryza sativa subsp. japonica TaxID=39947 RepID=Q6ZD11_ORYSJ|nr:hypothetical protein [Oryza sativa Japonica Group]